MINAGQIYRHYRGGLYRILAVALLEATHEQLVIYQNIDTDVIYTDVDNPEKIWARPLSIFTEQIDEDGRPVSRFARVETAN